MLPFKYICILFNQFSRTTKYISTGCATVPYSRNNTIARTSCLLQQSYILAQNWSHAAEDAVPPSTFFFRNIKFSAGNLKRDVLCR